MSDPKLTPFIEKYEQMFVKDPTSRIFAPLAEAYRRAGRLKEALQVAQNGVKQHPNFASGRVALGRILMELAHFEEARDHLSLATDLSGDNLLAQQLLADCFLSLGEDKKALQAMKMVLFLNPNDPAVAQRVKELEKKVWGQSITSEGDDSDDDAFGVSEYKMTELSSIKFGKPAQKVAAKSANASLDRELLLFDAWFERGDWSKAREILTDLLVSHPHSPDLLQRREKLDSLSRTNIELDDESLDWISPIDREKNSKQIQQLEDLIQRVESRKRP